jgi:tetratricopeptide (TPR) repeat protein
MSCGQVRWNEVFHYCHMSPIGSRNVYRCLRMSDLKPAIMNIEARPAGDGGSAARCYELGGLKLAHGDAEGAIAAYQQCLALAPPQAAVFNNLGSALLKDGRFEAAIAALEAALALDPGYLRALVNLGKALREAGRAAEAVAPLNQALASNPDYAPALVNLGDALAATGDLDAAQQALERSIRLAPTLVEAHMSLGIARLQAGRIAESIDALRAAVALAPSHADAHSNLGHALFVAGEWEAAWPHFEHRFRRHAHRVPLRPPAGVARWDGTVSADLELWLLGEQGLGDQLQFVRYAKILHDRGVRCVIACNPRLVKILRAAELGARIVPFETAADTPTARWISLISLPGWHRTRPDTVPAAAGYLAADPIRVARWRARLPKAAGLRVALAWAGNPRMETGRHAGRSPPLTALAPLMAVPHVNFISLQKGHGEEQLESVPFSESILRLPDLDAGPDAFLDTAAILKCVDLLVTSDSAIAHLAGALGVPTWLCLLREPDWRWMLKGADTPWYSSMRLFRQPAPGDWESVYEEIATHLRL